MTQEVAAYYAGRNAAWRAIAENERKVEVIYSEAALKKAFYQGARDAFAEERLSLDMEWDGE